MNDREYVCWPAGGVSAMPCPELTPATVLRAMILAYEAAWLDRVEKCAVAGEEAELDDAADYIVRVLPALRAAYCVATRNLIEPVFVPGKLHADYEARLRGAKPLHAAPEVP